MAEELIGENFFKKLKIARKLIGLTQRQMALELNRKQRDISLIENGIRNKLIPHDIISYLYAKGIDLNWLYDPTDSDSMTEEEVELKAFRHKGKAVYYLVRLNQIPDFYKCASDELVYHFEVHSLPGITADPDKIYVGFVVGKDTSPWQAEDIVICRKAQLSQLKAGADYLLVTSKQVVSKTLAEVPNASSDEYIHWLDGKIPIKNTDQIWEPIRSLVGSIGNPLGAANAVHKIIS